MKNDKNVHDLLGTVSSSVELFVVRRLQVCADGSTGTVPVPFLCAMMMTVVSEARNQKPELNWLRGDLKR
jgi:hypothetical protein